MHYKKHRLGAKDFVKAERDSELKHLVLRRVVRASDQRRKGSHVRKAVLYITISSRGMSWDAFLSQSSLPNSFEIHRFHYTPKFVSSDFFLTHQVEFVPLMYS